MPPALFIAGSLDPILDDSRSMYEQWRQTGQADILIVPEGPHGFERLPTRLAEKTRNFVYEWINRRISPSNSAE